MSTAGNDKMQHVVNLSFWINQDEGVHMCDVLDRALIYGSPLLYISSF